jgi:hypothetical protein
VYRGEFGPTNNGSNSSVIGAANPAKTWRDGNRGRKLGPNQSWSFSGNMKRGSHRSVSLHPSRPPTHTSSHIYLPCRPENCTCFGVALPLFPFSLARDYRLMFRLFVFTSFVLSHVHAHIATTSSKYLLWVTPGPAKQASSIDSSYVSSFSLFLLPSLFSL